MLCLELERGVVSDRGWATLQPKLGAESDPGWVGQFLNVSCGRSRLHMSRKIKHMLDVPEELCTPQIMPLELWWLKYPFP